MVNFFVVVGQMYFDLVTTCSGVVCHYCAVGYVVETELLPVGIRVRDVLGVIVQVWRGAGVATVTEENLVKVLSLLLEIITIGKDVVLACVGVDDVVSIRMAYFNVGLAAVLL